MRSDVVVIVGPGLKISVSLFGVDPVLGVGPLAQSSLDKALGFAIGARRIGSGAAMLESHLQASAAKLTRAITAAVVGEQGAHADAVAGEELDRRVEESDGSCGFLIGQHLGEGQAGVVVDGNVQGQETGMLALAAQAAIAAPA